NLLPFSDEATERMRLQLERAGWVLRPREFLAMRSAIAVACPVVTLTVIGTLNVEIGLWRAPIALVLALGGWFAPRIFLGIAQQRRLRAIEKQLPDALQAMAKSLRAGTGLLQALDYAANET